MINVNFPNWTLKSIYIFFKSNANIIKHKLPTFQMKLHFPFLVILPGANHERQPLAHRLCQDKTSWGEYQTGHTGSSSLKRGIFMGNPSQPAMNQPLNVTCSSLMLFALPGTHPLPQCALPSPSPPCQVSTGARQRKLAGRARPGAKRAKVEGKVWIRARRGFLSFVAYFNYRY